MHYPLEIRSKKAFVSWAKEQVGQAKSHQFCMRLFDCLYIHTSPRLEGLYGPFVPFDLPESAREAGELWDRIMDDEITVFMLSESDMGTWWCAAKLAVWNELRQLHTFLDIGDFREVTYEQFESIVGDDGIFREMLHEARSLGISVRDATHLRTADGELLLEKRKAEQKKAKMKPTRKSKAEKPTNTKDPRTKKKR
ncbi:MAG: hypothetical protein AB1696_28765 [Planctomycetota bacterium]